MMKVVAAGEEVEDAEEGGGSIAQVKTHFLKTIYFRQIYKCIISTTLLLFWPTCW